jgi:hypothetical protein
LGLGGTTRNVKTNVQSLRWLLTIAALILALPASTETRPRPPKASDVAGAWSGYSNHRDFVRLEFKPSGTGYVSITWLLPDDPPPDVYRITRWRLSEWSVEADVEPVTRGAEPMNFKSIRYGHRSIECEFGSTNWSHRAELFGELKVDACTLLSTWGHGRNLARDS